MAITAFLGTGTGFGFAPPERGMSGLDKCATKSYCTVANHELSNTVNLQVLFEIALVIRGNGKKYRFCGSLTLSFPTIWPCHGDSTIAKAASEVLT